MTLGKFILKCVPGPRIKRIMPGSVPSVTGLSSLTAPACLTLHMELLVDPSLIYNDNFREKHYISQMFILHCFVGHCSYAINVY